MGHVPDTREPLTEAALERWGFDLTTRALLWRRFPGRLPRAVQAVERRTRNGPSLPPTWLLLLTLAPKGTKADALLRDLAADHLAASLAPSEGAEPPAGGAV